jgi:hypothetical protein
MIVAPDLARVYHGCSSFHDFTPSSVPGALRDRPQWVAWKLSPRPRGKPAKMPVNPRTGAKADATDPRTWGAYDEALAVARDRGLAGVGFVFSDADPFAGIDLDLCRDPAAEFGPKKLKAVRVHMVALGWCRNQVNKHVGRIKRVFSWAVEEEMVPGSVAHALREVRGLKAGRSDAWETEKVRPVADDDVAAVLPFLPAPVRAMVELQKLSGMRPGEVCIMRARDIDRTRDVWEYTPQRHKNDWRGKPRVVFLGPRSQAVLGPFLTADPDAYLFSPAEAEASGGPSGGGIAGRPCTRPTSGTWPASGWRAPGGPRGRGMTSPPTAGPSPGRASGPAWPSGTRTSSATPPGR